MAFTPYTKPEVTPEEFGARRDGTTDDTAAINAALAASNHVRLRPGTYLVNGTVTVQAGKVLEGHGGSNAGVSPGATNIKMNNAAAQIWARGAGHQLKNFSIDANNVATNPLVTGGTAGGDAGAQPYYEGLTVMQAGAGGIAWKISASQNGTVVGCNILNNGGEGIVQQDHAGGWVFTRTEITGSGVRNYRSTDAGNNTFIGGVIERCMHATNSPVYIESTVWFPTIQFRGTTFASGGVAVSGPSRALVEMVATGTLELISCQFGGITNEYAIQGGNGATAPVIAVSGVSYFTGSGLLAFLNYDSTTVVDLDGEVRGQVAGLTSGTVPLRSAGSPAANIGRFRLSANATYRTTSTDPADSSLVVGEAQVRYQRLIDGTEKWGPGGSTAPDTILARNGVASLFLTGGLETSKDVKTPRLRYSRQVFTLVADTSLTVDLSLGSYIVIQLNNFNLTGLTLNNGVLAQEVIFLIKQGGTTVTDITLPLIASSFYWNGGDAGVPHMTQTLLTWMSFHLELTENGLWIETQRSAPSEALDTTIAAWPASTKIHAGTRYLLPTGGIGFSLTSRTTGATFDATERDLWTFIPGGHYEVITATGACTWKCPPGITKVRNRGQGAGGQGGGGGTALNSGGVATQVGGGGGGIGATYDIEEAVTAGTTYNGTVAAAPSAAGGGGAANGNAGTAGTFGASSTMTFGGNTYTALGGSGGAGGGANSTTTVGGGAGGAGAALTGTTFFLPGYGGAGITTGGVATLQINALSGGSGGANANATNGGNGGFAQTAVGALISTRTGQTGTANGANGTAATVPGAGGGGGGGGAPTGTGGNGGAGGQGRQEFWF